MTKNEARAKICLPETPVVLSPKRRTAYNPAKITVCSIVLVIILFKVEINGGSFFSAGEDFPVTILKVITILVKPKRKMDTQSPSVLTIFTLSSNVGISFCLKTARLSLEVKTVIPPTNTPMATKSLRLYPQRIVARRSDELSFSP